MKQTVLATPIPANASITKSGTEPASTKSENSTSSSTPTRQGKSYFKETFESEPDAPIYVVSHSTKKDKIVGPIYELVGEIKNNSTEEVPSVSITATFYDDNGVVIGIDSAYTDPQNIQPGRTAPYKFTIGFGDTIDVNDIAEAKYNLQWE